MRLQPEQGDDGFQGMKCEIECPKHYGLHCNERACRTRDAYVLGGEMYVNRPCTTDKECGRCRLP